MTFNKDDIYAVRIEPEFGVDLYVAQSDYPVVIELTTDWKEAQIFIKKEAEQLATALNSRGHQPFVENELPVGRWNACGRVFPQQDIQSQPTETERRERVARLN